MTDAELQSVIMNFGRRQPITTNSTSATMSHALAILSLSVLLALIMPGQIVASDHRIPMKIAAVGDSITYGACSTDPERYSYWARLQVRRCIYVYVWHIYIISARVYLCRFRWPSGADGK